MDYKQAGVDVEAGYQAVERIKRHAARTFDTNVLGGIGSFGSMYSLQGFAGMTDPVLVSGTDGVGTKLKIAFAMDKHDTVGIDCVAMCVNDVVCQGAKPLFFLDYIATGKLVPEQVADIVKGVAEGCLQAGCALIGGETAEMPGFYAPGEYDMAGFAVGIAERAACVDGSGIRAGDVLIGLASSGVHSNGFSLVRRLFGEDARAMARYEADLGATLGETLLTPTRIYVQSILSLLNRFTLKGVAHITGGGFIENIPRMLPAGLCARIEPQSWRIPPIFPLMQRTGNITERAMYNTFNMGIGMVLAVDADTAQPLLAACAELGEQASIIGSVEVGEGSIRLWL